MRIVLASRGERYESFERWTELTTDTAFDTTHPYYDPKSDKDAPTWYMVNVRFVRRLEHPVTLAWVKKLAGLAEPPEGVKYIGKEGLKAIKEMPLVNRGRLSVQPVSEEAYDAIVAMGEKGGMDELPVPKKAKAVKREKEDENEEGQKDEPDNGKVKKEPASKKAKTEPKPKAEPKVKKEPPPAPEGTRRSSRLRK